MTKLEEKKDGMSNIKELIKRRVTKTSDRRDIVRTKGV